MGSLECVRQSLRQWPWHAGEGQHSQVDFEGYTEVVRQVEGLCTAGVSVHSKQAQLLLQIIILACVVDNHLSRQQKSVRRG